jgi:hypothetical protein
MGARGEICPVECDFCLSRVLCVSASRCHLKLCWCCPVCFSHRPVLHSPSYPRSLYSLSLSLSHTHTLTPSPSLSLSSTEPQQPAVTVQLPSTLIRRPLAAASSPHAPHFPLLCPVSVPTSRRCPCPSLDPRNISTTTTTSTNTNTLVSARRTSFRPTFFAADFPARFRPRWKIPSRLAVRPLTPLETTCEAAFVLAPCARTQAHLPRSLSAWSECCIPLARTGPRLHPPIQRRPLALFWLCDTPTKRLALLLNCLQIPRRIGFVASQRYCPRPLADVLAFFASIPVHHEFITLTRTKPPCRPVLAQTVCMLAGSTLYRHGP